LFEDNTGLQDAFETQERPLYSPVFDESPDKGLVSGLYLNDGSVPPVSTGSGMGRRSPVSEK